MKYRKVLFLVMVIFLFQKIIAQQVEFSIDEKDLKYYSLKEGAKNPEQVYALKVSIYNDKYLNKNRDNPKKLKEYFSRIAEFDNLRSLTVDGYGLDISPLFDVIQSLKKLEKLYVYRNPRFDFSLLFDNNSLKDIKYL